MCLQGMVCVLEEGNALCIVRDQTTGRNESTNKINIIVPASTTVQELLQEVGRKYQYDSDSFELLLQRSSDSNMIVLNEHREKNIEAIGVNFESGTRNMFIITDLPGTTLRKVTTTDAGEDDMLLGASASPTAGGDYTHSSPAPPPPPIMSTSTEYTYTSAIIKPDTGYVGLVNQAMTCYLNSLLQALYMTPEFRNALYKWEFDGTEQEEAKSIPYQLQKLFLLLQTSAKSAVETTELTRSFGWHSNEAWQQHDIQELCRVMFDALEQKVTLECRQAKKNPSATKMKLSKMIDYVKCLDCSTEKSREDTFLDIPLPVRPFGSTVAYGSVEEALRAFVQPETLDGNNQYFCEKCNKKCDAHKGLKFSKFPYLLTLHLKRFDFDYQTLHRIKLNDKVVFPDLLNLNSFILTAASSKEDSEPVTEDMIVKNDDSSTTDSGSALDDESCQGTDTTILTQDIDYQEDDEGIDMSNGPNHHENEKNRRHTLQRGPYMYELFSIMIHSGSASGGHYYAYIKDFKSKEWFCFNDQTVSRITKDDIQKTYGGGPLKGYYSGAYSSSTNAYMLMYRQIDKTRNCDALSAEEFPPHIKNLLLKIQQKEESDRLLLEKEMDMCKLKVYFRHPTTNTVTYIKLPCENQTILREVTFIAYKILKLEDVIPLDRCRLVNYDHLQDTIECSFEGREEDPIGDILYILRSNFKYDLLLETRREDQNFEVYRIGGVAIKVFVVNVETEEVDGPTIVRGNLSQTVKEFKGTLAKVLNLNADTLKIIFVANSCDEDPEKPYVISKLHKIIDRFEHIITLHLVLPDLDKETLDKLVIPPLVVDVNHNGSSDCSPKSCENCDTLGVEESDGSAAGTTARDNSPQLLGDAEDEGMGATGHSDQSASEDSSLTDSDRTIVGDAPDECLAQLSSPSDSPPGSDQQNVSSPEEGNTNTYHSFAKEPSGATENWDDEEADTYNTASRASNYYFRATPYKEDSHKMLKVLVDKRMILGTLKKDLETYVGVPLEYFKIYRLYSNQQEYECARLTETLSTFRDDEKLTVRLGRALRKGEHRGKVYQLLLNAKEPSKFLCDWILGKGMLVGDAKREILEELKRKYSINISYDRCRLRKKSWKNPGKVYLDTQKFEDISLFANWEMFLQELPGPEPATSSIQLLLFVRQWCPSTLELKPFDEVLLDGTTISELKEKISALSGIPVENLELAKGQSSFPCDMSVLGIHTELDWAPQTVTVDSWPFNIYEDGHVILYRDSREEVKQLTSEERKEIANKEGCRMGKLSSTVSTYSPRKERALKIYLDSSPKKHDDIDVD
uniref:Ubiquitin carboxyl-terminal hydrolase 47 n=1 Tax=Timema poppense TaxID=170557 RepID=A0A7R9CG28_TIMPO|nr:unnamed protein product [Timema poppensis]